MCAFSKHRSFFTILLLISTFILSAHTTSFSQDTDEEKDLIEIYNEAQDAHEKGDFAKALKLYEEALKIAPEFPEAEFQRGNALQSLGRLSEAEKAFRQAIVLRENWVLPITSLGEILVRNGKYAEAETILNKAITLDGANTSAYLALTELRLKTKSNPDSLKQLLVKLSNLQNQDTSVWTAKGAIEKYLGDKISAKTSLTKALSFEPKNQYALSEMADLLIAENKLDEALLIAQNLVKYSPNLVSSKILLAKVYAEKGNTIEAIKILDALDNLDANVLLLRNEITAKETKDIPLLEKQLESNPKNALFLGRLCILTRTNPAKSLEYCRRASEAEPSNIGHAVGFGAALVQAKQFVSAVNLLNKLLQFEPDNYAIHSNLATSYFELKKYSEAANEFKWLIGKKPDLSVAYFFLAIAHDNLAEYSEALKNYQIFLQLADSKQNQLEIDKVNLRLPILEKQVKRGEGVKKGRKQ